MNKKWKATFAFVLVVGSVITLSQVTGAVKPLTLQESVQAGTAHINYHRPDLETMRPETAKFLQNSWDKGEKVVTAYLQNKDDNQVEWKKISSADIDIEFTNQLTLAEASSFYGVFRGEEKNKALKVGDIFPAALLHPDQHRVIVYWERKDGSFVFLDFQSDENKEWSLTEGPIELKAFFPSHY